MSNYFWRFVAFEVVAKGVVSVLEIQVTNFVSVLPVASETTSACT